MVLIGVVELKNNKSMSMSQENNEREIKRKRGLSRLTKAAIIVSLFFVACIFGSGIVQGLVAKFFVRAVPAAATVLEETLETDFILLREDTVVPAPCAGALETVCQEGERVAKGAVVGYLIILEGTSLEKEKRIPLVSPVAGLLSFKLDGYEHIFHPDMWSKLDLSKLDAPGGVNVQADGEPKKNEETRAAVSGMVEAGQDLFRITDNLRPSLLYFAIKAPLPEVLRDGEVEIRLREPEDLSLQGTVHDIFRDGDIYRAVVKIPSRMELLDLRRVKGAVITNKFRGVVLEKEALVMRDNTPGVYILNKGQVAWREIEIIGTVDSRVAVAGLGKDDWIVVSAPVLVKEGQRIFFYNKYN